MNVKTRNVLKMFTTFFPKTFLIWTEGQNAFYVFLTMFLSVYLQKLGLTKDTEMLTYAVEITTPNVNAAQFLITVSLLVRLIKPPVITDGTF